MVRNLRNAFYLPFNVTPGTRCEVLTQSAANHDVNMSTIDHNHDDMDKVPEIDEIPAEWDEFHPAAHEHETWMPAKIIEIRRDERDIMQCKCQLLLDFESDLQAAYDTDWICIDSGKLRFKAEIGQNSLDPDIQLEHVKFLWNHHFKTPENEFNHHIQTPGMFLSYLDMHNRMICLLKTLSLFPDNDKHSESIQGGVKKFMERTTLLRNYMYGYLETKAKTPVERYWKDNVYKMSYHTTVDTLKNLWYHLQDVLLQSMNIIIETRIYETWQERIPCNFTERQIPALLEFVSNIRKLTPSPSDPSHFLNNPYLLVFPTQQHHQH
ncbi:hypothetical protein N9E76_00560 [bacterium]|nr:hypothetical protein [bacterium]